MKRPPSFGFFPDNWLGSSRIAVMTPAEEGAYIRLLCLAWNSPEMDAGLPDDDGALAIMSRLGDSWARGSGAKLRACFESRGGRLYNEKLSHEWERATQYAESRRANAKHKPNTCKGYAQHIRVHIREGKGRESIGMDSPVLDGGTGEGVVQANRIALTAWLLAEYRPNASELSPYEEHAAFDLCRNRPDFPAELTRVRAWKAKCDKEGMLFKRSIRAVLDCWQDIVDQSIVMVKEQADAEAYRKQRAEILAKVERGEIMEDRNG